MSSSAGFLGVRAVIFLLAFTLEVRAQAATSMTQEPANCLQTKSEKCALRATERPETIKVGKTEIVLDRASSIVRMSENEVLFLSGQIWVKANGEFSVRTEYGSFAAQESGDFWVARSNGERISISAASTNVDIKPRGGSESIEVPKGMGNWLEPVGANGVAGTGIPVAIEFKGHVERWAKLFARTKAEFETELRQFHADWSIAKETAAALHKEVYDRKIASIDNERVRVAKARAAKEAKDREFREMFRRKIFED